MTATQVFLRFIEEEYTNADGTVNARLLLMWRETLLSNYICCDYKRDKCGWVTSKKRFRTSKNFVDDYLYRNRLTLNGFIRRFLWCVTSVSTLFIYGYSSSSIERNLDKKWKSFLNKHINETSDFRKYWTPTRKFNFTWKF